MMKFGSLLFGCMLVSTQAMAAGNPVRVARDANGNPHFFERWNGSAYEPKVLRGAASFDFGGPNDIGSHYGPLFQGLRNQGMNFVRMWMRPSDGMFSSNYQSGVAVGLRNMTEYDGGGTLERFGTNPMSGNGANFAGTITVGALQ